MSVCTESGRRTGYCDGTIRAGCARTPKSRSSFARRSRKSLRTSWTRRLIRWLKRFSTSTATRRRRKLKFCERPDRRPMGPASVRRSPSPCSKRRAWSCASDTPNRPSSFQRAPTRPPCRHSRHPHPTTSPTTQLPRECRNRLSSQSNGWSSLVFQSLFFLDPWFEVGGASLIGITHFQFKRFFLAPNPI